MRRQVVSSNIKMFTGLLLRDLKISLIHAAIRKVLTVSQNRILQSVI